MRHVLLIGSILLVTSATEAKTIYVDNRVGSDVNDGTAATVTGLRSGPVRTFRRAQVLAGTGDVIEIANTGQPYYDSLRLIGGNCSGVPSQPFLVNGNGAVIDGSDPVDPRRWTSMGGDLWMLDPLEKGWFVLVRDDQALPEVAAPHDAGRPNPPPGHWAAWRGAIYYHAEPDELPANESYRIATRAGGLFLYGVHDVLVRDLTVRHFRIDGVSAHDQAYRAVIQNVVSESNGRSGLFVGGSGDVVIRGGATRNNREASLLIRERGKADVQDVALDAEPVVAD